MTSDGDEQKPEQAEETPDTKDLEEPSTEKEPDEEPTKADTKEPEPSHEAVGIGVIGAPLVDPEQPEA